MALLNTDTLANLVTDIDAFIRAHDPSQKGTFSCDSDTPCCVTSLTIQDKAGTNRKIEWPVPVDGHDKLLIIADKATSAELYGEVAVEWQGSSCKLGVSGMPCIEVDPSNAWTDFLAFEAIRHTKKKFDTKIGCKDYAFASYIKDLVPEQAEPYLTAFDIIMNLGYFLQMLGDPASFRAKQCCPGKGGTPVLMVAAVPRIKMSGKITLSFTLIFSTVGINVSCDFKSELTATFGSLELGHTTEKPRSNKTFKGKINNDKNSGNRQKPKGFLGTVGKMADKIKSTIEKMTRKTREKARKRKIKEQRKLDDIVTKLEKMAEEEAKQKAAKEKGQAEFATNITIQPELIFECIGIELKAVDNAPDLALDYGNASAEFSVTVSGQLNILEMVANYFWGLGTALIKAQEAMAKNEKFHLKVQTTLKLSAKGNAKYSVSLSGKDALVIKPDGTFDDSKAGLTENIDGAIRIVGEGVICIEIGAEVWIFEAETGGGGAVFTAWTWQWKILEKGPKQRSYFEGMYGIVYAYYDVKVNNGDKEGDTTSSNKRGFAKQEAGTKDIITTDSNKPLTNQVREKYNPKIIKKGVWELIAPETKTITDKEPRWNDFK